MAPSILKEGMKQEGLAVKPSLVPDEQMTQMLEEINFVLNQKTKIIWF